MKTLFLDTEFTELTQDASLLSIALVDENDRYFYGVFSDTATDGLSPWHQEKILPFLSLTDMQLSQLHGEGLYTIESTKKITDLLIDWLEEYDQVVIWADVPAYDWVLFAQLFGGARQLPEKIHYMVRDLATLFVANGLDPDTDRFKFAYQDNPPANLVRHNALGDALCAKACYQILMNRLNKPNE